MLFKFKFFCIDLFSDLKKILHSSSSLIVDGIVGKPLLSLSFIDSIFFFKLELFLSYLIQNLEYQKVKLKSLNIYPIKSIEPVGIVKEVVKNNSNRPINVALTINPKAMIDLKAKLYLTGLVLKYSEKAIDNVTMLKNNWEFSFNIESLNEPVTNTITKKINNNYILPLLVLNGYYSDNGKISDAKSFETLALKVAIEGGKEMEVKEYIEAKK